MTDQEIHEYITSMKPASYEDAVAIISMLPEDGVEVDLRDRLLYKEYAVWVGNVRVSTSTFVAMRRWYIRVGHSFAEVYDY